MLTAVRYAVRPMGPGDIAQVVDIERESFPSTWPQTTYKRELQNRLARYLVLVEETLEPPTAPRASDESSRGLRDALRRLFGRDSRPEPTQELIVGFVGLWLMVGEAHIVTLAVRESQRRRGLGELLLMAAIEVAVAHGQEVVTLEVRRSNEAALALYDKYSFTRAGLRRRYYENAEDAVIMTTPPLDFAAFQECYRLLKEAHQRRWGGAYSLPEDMEG